MSDQLKPVNFPVGSIRVTPTNEGHGRNRGDQNHQGEEHNQQEPRKKKRPSKPQINLANPVDSQVASEFDKLLSGKH